MAAAKDISKHFQSLRADTGRRKGRPSPFATGFEDDSDEEKQRRSRSKTKQASAAEKPTTTAKTGTKLSPATDILRDSEDEFLDPPKRTDRRPSPAPATLPVSRVTDGAGRRGSLPGSPDKGLTGKGAQGRAIQVNRAPRSAVAQAAGNLAYLDDSDSDQDSRSRTSTTNRYPSPAPRKTSDPNPPARSSTPKGTREAPRELGEGVAGPTRNSIASPFAGTKYLQDSDSDDDDEKAVSSRKSSVEDPLPDLASSPDKSRLEVKRVDKPKTQHGGGVSWRAFSEGRAEQRTQEIEALTSSLKQRGKSISFGSHALTDDGKRVPVQPSPEQIFGGVGLRKKSRGKSPPRRAEDTKPTEDEVADGSSGLGIYDPTQYKTNPFTGQPVRRSSNDNETSSKSGDRPSTPTGPVPDVRVQSVT